MTSCLQLSRLQGCLEESGRGSLCPAVESHIASCARCRTLFERLASTHHRVNVWLSRLSPPRDAAVNVGQAWSRVQERAGKPSFAGLQPAGNPWAMGSSLVLQAALVAILLLAGHAALPPKTHAETWILSPPPVVKLHEARRFGGRPFTLPAGQTPKVFTAAVPVMTRTIPTLLTPSLVPPAAWTGSSLGIPDPLAGLGGPGTGPFPGAGGDGSGAGGGGDGDTGTRGAKPVFDIGNGTTPPKLLVSVDPEYSEEARKAHYNGVVELSIVVNSEGRAEDIRIVRSLGMGLDEKAIEAVRKWRFQPGRNKNVPVNTRARVQVNFRLL